MKENETQKKDEKKNNKKWIILSVISILLFFVGVPFVIDNLYIQGGPIITVWDGPQFLSFYGAALSAIGALFLGGISIYQNNKLNKINEAAQKRIEDISNHTNEVSVINHIVDCERERISEFNKLTEEFIDYCNNPIECLDPFPPDIVENLLKQEQVRLDRYKNSIIQSVNLSIFENSAEGEFVINLAQIVGNTSGYITAHKNMSDLEKYNKEVYFNRVKDFKNSRDMYIFQANSMIVRILTNNYKLSEIKELYNKRIKEGQYGQDEDAE